MIYNKTKQERAFLNFFFLTFIQEFVLFSTSSSERTEEWIGKTPEKTTDRVVKLIVEVYKRIVWSSCKGLKIEMKGK